MKILLLMFVSMSFASACPKSLLGTCLKEGDNVTESIADSFEGVVSRVISDEEVEVIFNYGTYDYDKTLPPGYLLAEDASGCTSSYGKQSLCVGDKVLYRTELEFHNAKVLRVYEGAKVLLDGHKDMFSASTYYQKIVGLTSRHHKSIECSDGICVGNKILFRNRIYNMRATGPVVAITARGICHFLRDRGGGYDFQPYASPCSELRAVPTTRK
jgi:hypothetical protein